MVKPIIFICHILNVLNIFENALSDKTRIYFESPQIEQWHPTL